MRRRRARRNQFNLIEFNGMAIDCDVRIADLNCSARCFSCRPLIIRNPAESRDQARRSGVLWHEPQYSCFDYSFASGLPWEESMTRSKVFHWLIAAIAMVQVFEATARADGALDRTRAVLDDAPVVDGHNDLPWVIRKSSAATSKSSTFPPIPSSTRTYRV